MKPSTPALYAYVDRSLSVEEATLYLETPISEDERRTILDLIAWFRRRYPTALERLHYVDRAYSRWTRA